MQEIWNTFHRQDHFISKGFSNFERTSSKIELPFLQMFISFAYQNVAILCVKRISFFLEFFMFLLSITTFQSDGSGKDFNEHWRMLIQLRSLLIDDYFIV